MEGIVMNSDPLELLLGSVVVYFFVCAIFFAVYKWRKDLELFVAKVFMVTACWAAGLSLSPELGEPRWFVVALQIGFAVFLMIYSRRLYRERMKIKSQPAK
jgi:hypothetical protein